MWNDVLFSVLIPTAATMIFFIFTVNLIRHFFGGNSIQIRDSTKEHNWNHIQNTSKAYYCSICSTLLLNEFYCDSCGVCADGNCLKIADKQLKCKAITSSDNQPMKHHWIKGNLPLAAMCDVCDEECYVEPGLMDYWCCWCQKSVHEICKSRLNDQCDFGRFRSMIIPPASLVVVNRRATMRRRLQLRSIHPPVWKDWNPVIVVGNQKSGNKDGAEILSAFRLILNPAQVVDLSQRDPVAALEWCRLLGDIPCNILVAGGDGTVAWLLNSIHKLQLKAEPSIAILPLGTGNDLSRVLGWGKEFNADTDCCEVLQHIQEAPRVKLDRWIVTRTGSRLRGNPQFFMYNYISFGVDAQVTLNFHKTRESRFYVYSHRIINKLLYLCFGTQQVVERENRNLDQRIEVYIDDERIPLPSIESIVVLNIPSWGAGVNLWNMGLEGNESFGEQSFSDGKLEVVAIYSSFHMAQLQVGLSKPHLLGQGKSVKVKLLQSCAVQADGEPWYQHPCEFTVSHCNQASVLMGPDG